MTHYLKVRSIDNGLNRVLQVICPTCST